MNAPESITIRPNPAEWALAESAGLFSRDRIERFREELQLPAGPIVMSGHQAEWWHPGILAKYLTAAAFAKRSNAAFVWLVVDQDTGTPESMRYPGSGWMPQMIRFASEGDEVRPLCERKTLQPRRIPSRPLCTSVGATIDEIIEALNRHATTANLARQITETIRERLPTSHAGGNVIFASDVAKTELFSEMTRLMKADVISCVHTYNEAVDAHPEAKVRRLREGTDPELPLWSVSADGVRSATRLSTSNGRLLPRALTMTALMRAAGCELFIHGLGGGVYDRITEHWMRSWKNVTLAPMAVVSATRYPWPHDAPRIVTSAEAIAALTAAHRAWHHPAELGDHNSESWRDDIVKRIARESMPARNASYRTLQTWLKAYRERNDTELRERYSKARELQIAARSGTGAFDRTMPFFFLSDDRIEQLRSECEQAFGPRGDA